MGVEPAALASLLYLLPLDFKVWSEFGLFSCYSFSGFIVVSVLPCPGLAGEAKAHSEEYYRELTILSVAEGALQYCCRDSLFLEFFFPGWPSPPCGRVLRQRVKPVLNNCHCTVDIFIDVAPSCYSMLDFISKCLLLCAYTLRQHYHKGCNL